MQTPTIIYHMCLQSQWDKAMAAHKAYFPPTFETDGYFTHATSKPSLLLTTANHYYTHTQGDWICIAMSEPELRRVGIVTRYEVPMPVGDKLPDASMTQYDFPHVYGGLPGHLPGIVIQIYPMRRDSDGRFLSIEGLVEALSES
jgi:uncharacterized protein (DUF952 family)